MSEGCSSQINKPKLTAFLTEKLNNLSKNNIKDYLNHSHEDTHASTSNAPVNSINVNVKSGEFNKGCNKSEVKFLEEWLFLHLDLIREHNAEIDSKERTIFVLQQENEMLREHINCLQGGIAYVTRTTLKSYSCTDMTQDAAHTDDEKSLVYNCGSRKSTMTSCIKSCGNVNDILSYNNSVINRNRLQVSCDLDLEVATNCNPSNRTDDKSLCTLKEPHISITKQNNIDLVVNEYQNRLNDLAMSIRRKRLCSNSSAFSNNTSIEEPQPSRKRKKRSSTVIKDETILTCSDQYITQASEIGVIGVSSDPEHGEMPCTSNLETPRWRIRVYSSLYSMEGTEDLDDDVFNRRHMRLENDERRRKRWDVQRIREQRVVEKLKLRQERIARASDDDKSKPVSSLWPALDDIKYIEVCDELPVSAFGAPVPRLTPSEFSLPWLVNSEKLSTDILELQQPQPLEPRCVKKISHNRKPRKRRRIRKRFFH